MTGIWVAIVPGMVLGLGLALLLIQFAPRHAHVSDALKRLGTITPPATVRHTTFREGLGSWVYRHVPNLPGFTAPTKALDLLEIPVTTYYAEKAIYAAAGLLLPTIISLPLQLTGSPSLVLPAILGPFAAVIAWFCPDQRIKAKAKAARREFTRFTTVYLELVAVALLGSTNADRALADATTLSSSWVFARIRREYAFADLTGATKWEALDRLSQAVEVPALGDMARTMRLTEASIPVRTQLRAACTKLRKQLAADDAIAAAAVTNLLNAPLLCTLIPIFVLLLTPTVLQATQIL